VLTGEPTNATNWRRHDRLRWPRRTLEAFGGRADEAANYWSCTSSRTDLALAARQLAQDIP
jgi:hypothetical protein